MEYDTMNITDGNMEKTIYILLEIDRNRHHYVIYSDRILDQYDENCVFVGEFVDEKIIPVSQELLGSFDEFIKKIISR